MSARLPRAARLFPSCAIALIAACTLLAAAPAAEIPARLTDQEYWKLVQDLSEPNGSFRSDNLVSNEDTLQVVIPRLLTIVKPQGVYLGVGPDQNLTYIAALKPKIAFIVDIRRGNLQAHLMYKALFELSADRADFLSRLFSRRRPAGLGPGATADQLLAAYAISSANDDLMVETREAIRQQLTVKHGFALAESDLPGIEFVLSSFRMAGPALSYSTTMALRNGMVNIWGPRYPTFGDLQTATDGDGHARSFLATEDAYRAVKTFEERNLLVPIVGDFAGPKAVRAVGAWVRERQGTVTTFYLSNVEQYLFGDGIWPSFAENVAALPLDDSSTFIRSCFTGCASSYASRAVMQIDSMKALIQDYREGKIKSYIDVLSHVRAPGPVEPATTAR